MCWCVTDMIYYTSLGFFPPSFLSVPFPHEPCSHSRLSSVSVNRDFGHRLRPLAFAVRASFFFFSPPLGCWCFLFGMQEGDHRATKSYTDENWGCLLFVSSAIPRCPPSHFSSGVTSLLFPVVLEPCQQTPLDRDMQILSLENSSASQPSCPCIDCGTFWT